MSNDDLAAVREFRAALDEPRDGALAKRRWQVARAESPERPRRRPWVLATAGAAVAVAVVVGGGAAAVHTATPRHENAVVPGQSVAGSPSPSGADLPVTRGTKAPMNPAVTGKAGASHPQAVEALTRLAAKQTGGPLAIGADQTLYVKTYSLADGEGRYIHEAWTDVTTGVALRIRRTDESPRGIDRSLSQKEIDEATALSRDTPPGLHNFNGAYVAAFPAGADQAHQLAATWKDWAQKEYPGRGADGLIFTQVREIFHYVDPLLTAAQRGALYLAIIDLPSVKATTATIDGRQYDAICVSGQADGPQCLLFDQATGRYAGEARTGTDMVVQAGRFTFVDVGVQPRPAVGPDRTIPGKKGSAPTPTS
ncbi:hypothetical protein AB0K00_10990 [Dactylosporangium sp. NPDC049525]|uniref:hypothetical protein n=1 Tax=Dactylosporangium sp. NPDC049525 TaxID=3154730 RepID=UPI0034494239